IDVSFDGLHRVVFARGHLLHRCGVHDVVDAIKCSVEAIRVSDIADKEANSVVVDELGHLPHLVLFELVATEHDCLPWASLGEKSVNKLLTERAGSSRNQNNLAIQKIHLQFPSLD